MVTGVFLNGSGSNGAHCSVHCKAGKRENVSKAHGSRVDQFKYATESKLFRRGAIIRQDTHKYLGLKFERTR